MTRKLVHIETKEQADAEGKTMQHAVGYWFPHLLGRGILVYSLRDENDQPVLTMSVEKKDDVWVCAHVVGRNNRQPTAEELEEVAELLAEKKCVLAYNPHTIC